MMIDACYCLWIALKTNKLNKRYGVEQYEQLSARQK